MNFISAPTAPIYNLPAPEPAFSIVSAIWIRSDAVPTTACQVSLDLAASRRWGTPTGKRATPTYQTIDGISYTHGKHAFKFGGEFRAAYSNSFDDFGTRQSLDFSAFSNFGF